MKKMSYEKRVRWADTAAAAAAADIDCRDVDQVKR